MILQGHDVEKVASMEKKEDRLLTIKEKIDNNGKSEKTSCHENSKYQFNQH